MVAACRASARTCVWAPDYGVGVVALANVTYARVHEACLEALGVLLDAAELPRAPCCLRRR